MFDRQRQCKQYILTNNKKYFSKLSIESVSLIQKDIEILSSFLYIKDFSNATDYEAKIEKLSMALTSIKSKKFVETIPIESKTDKIVQLELFK